MTTDQPRATLMPQWSWDCHDCGVPNTETDPPDYLVQCSHCGRQFVGDTRGRYIITIPARPEQ